MCDNRVEDLQEYIKLLVQEILKDALEAKKQHQEQSFSVSADFYAGKRLAYYEVLTTLCNRASLFDISTELLGLNKIDIDKDIA